MSKPQRKLATILATDCVNYSGMMENNEQETVIGIKACRNIIEDTIKEYGGRVFNTAGDSVIAEFGSPVDCVNAGIEFQKLISDRNKNIPNHRQMEFRVGVHLDDVVIEGDDIFGGGVNIAARLEGLCEPNCILISKTVHEHIAKKINIIIEHLGDKNLKNMADSFSVFQISPSSDIETISTDEYATDTSLNKKLRLCVLPFRNLNSNNENDDFIDGVVEDIITEFSLINSIEIISNAAAFSFKGKETNISEIQKQFNVNFILSGSIRSSGQKVRVSVELLDPEEGNTLWSNRYDRILDDIFEVQDEIVKNVMFSLTGEIEVKTLERMHRKPTDNLTSYENLLKGKRAHHKYKKESHTEAVNYFNKAIELDPDNGSAYAWKACTVGGGLQRGFFKNSSEFNIDNVQELIEKAREINQNDFECYRLLCRIYLGVYRDYEQSIEFGKKAYQLNPNDPRILFGYGEVLALSGRGGEALEYLLKAHELSPHIGIEGNVDVLISSVVLGYFSDGNYEECINWFKTLEKKDFRSFVLYISSLEKLSLLEDDSAQINVFKQKFGDLDYKHEIEMFGFKDTDTSDSFKNVCEGLLN